MSVSMDCQPPLVSVIIPVYKVEELLHRCVDSVLAQTHQRLEVILIDDGSPDKCGLICNDYATRDARVTVVHQENGGLSAARNAGLELASGDFITFVDSDDFLHPDMVAVLVDMVRQDDADIAVCGYVKTDVEPDAATPQPSRTVRVLTNVEALAELLGARYVNMVVAWGKLYRGHLFEGVTFPAGRVHEDEFTTHRLLWRAKRVTVTQAPLYYYWQRAGSITDSFSPVKRRDVRDAFRARAAFLHSVGLTDQASATYRKTFYVWRKDLQRVRDLRMGQARRPMMREIKELAREARRTPQPWRFRVRLETFALFPGLGEERTGVHGIRDGE